MNKVTIFAVGAFLITALSCQKEQTNVTEKTTTEVRAGKSEAIPDGEILKNYAVEAQQLLGSQLKQKIAEGGPENALEFCNINAIPLTDSISKKYDVRIKRVSDQYRNPNNAANPSELAVITTYKAMLAAGKKPEGLLKDGYYYSPIVTNAMCLQCHGTPGKDLAEKTHQKIKSLYPQDKATGYGVDELRGIFSIAVNP
ncbi:Tll0287-like domain-containing protein [Kaistella sp.]|uniref:Tll0287-like domain-containing protein n=1 Tax=Kaistella sp. TaxID=2782235 RepID=UPI002F927112